MLLNVQLAARLTFQNSRKLRSMHLNPLTLFTPSTFPFE